MLYCIIGEGTLGSQDNAGKLDANCTIIWQSDSVSPQLCFFIHQISCSPEENQIKGSTIGCPNSDPFKTWKFSSASNYHAGCLNFQVASRT